MEGHPYILARALTVYRNKVWKKYIHTFLPGPSLSPGTKYGRSTSIILARAFTDSRNKVWRKHIHNSCQGLYCFQEHRMEEHPYILARDFTESRNKESKHMDTLLPGLSLIPGTKYGGSTSIILARAFTVSRNIEWKNIHTFLPGTSLNQGTKKASIWIHCCLGFH